MGVPNKIQTTSPCVSRVTISVTWCNLRSRLVYLTRLRRRRLEHGWTLDDLARRTGLSRRSLSMLELSQREPRPSTIGRIARALDCEPRDLMEPEA